MHVIAASVDASKQLATQSKFVQEGRHHRHGTYSQLDEADFPAGVCARSSQHLVHCSPLDPIYSGSRGLTH